MRPPRLPRSRFDQRGITVIETLIASMVSGVLLATALPSLASSLRSHQLLAAVRTTMLHVQTVRSIAVTRNLKSRLVLSENGTKLSTEVYRNAAWESAGSPVVLSNGFAVTSILSGSTPATNVVFGTLGTADNNNTYTVTISGPTGSTRSLRVNLLGRVELT
jgi:Tfp pilus assembly protein FimT